MLACGNARRRGFSFSVTAAFAAVMLYSKGIKALGEGNKSEATTLFKKCVTDFPEFEKPKEELKRMGA